MVLAWRQALRTASVALGCLGALSLVSSVQPATAGDMALASEWTLGHKSRTRLSAAQAPKDGTSKQLYAFVEIELAEGWKTYWRNPGDSGIPPRFDFSKSKNLGTATVLYPAPKRIEDKGEAIVGYKGTVLFPVLITAADPAKPIELAADVQFGMCKDICVPTEATLALTVPENAAADLSEEAQASLKAVPAVAGASGPRVVSVSKAGTSSDHKLTLAATFPAGTAGADAFLEAPDGLYLPLLTKAGETGNDMTFEADLSKDVDLAALAGKTITVTLVSEAGASESSFKFE